MAPLPKDEAAKRGEETNDEEECRIYQKMATTSSTHHEKDDDDMQEACLLFAIVGVGYLFPFSALTQPVDYWNLLFPDFNIEFPLTTIYMYTNLIVLALLVFFCGGERGKEDSSTSVAGIYSKRIVPGFVGQLLVLVFVPTSYFWHLNERHNELAVLGATAFAAVVTAFIDSSIIAFSTRYPVRCQEYFQLGVGLSTLIGSVYRDATKIVFPPSQVVESSLLYFYGGAATVAVCIASYYRLLRLPISQKCLANNNNNKSAISEGASPNEMSSLLPNKQNGNNYGQPTQITTVQQQANNNSKSTKRWVVLKKIWFNECMVFLLFFTTLTLWPPLVTEIRSFSFPSLEASGWWSLILLSLFSVSDCLGRLLVRFRIPGLTDKPQTIWVPVMIRLVLLVPLIVWSAQGTMAWIQNDLISILGVTLLGLTNGYVGTLCIILVNECCDDEEERAVAGTFTGFFLNSGLVLGATVGLLLDEIVVK